MNRDFPQLGWLAGRLDRDKRLDMIGIENAAGAERALNTLLKESEASS